MTTIVTRAGKGSPLSWSEVDANFTNLNTDKLDTSTVGSTVQAHSANLDEYATVNPTAAGLALLADIDAAAQRTTLSLNNVDNTSDATKNAATATLTNKTIAASTNTVEAMSGPNNSPLSFRNKLINGEVTRINQRGFDGNWTSKNIWNAGNTIAQQELCYGYDMWAKASAMTMCQLIESGNFRPNTIHTLSGIGVTTQQITSPASGNWKIEVPQGATNVQVEEGLQATPFEVRPISFELAQCQRYLWRGLTSVGYSFSAWAAAAFMSFIVDFRTQLRTTPSLTFVSPGVTLNNVTSGTVQDQTANGFRYVVSAIATGSCAVLFNPTTDYFNASAVI